MKLTISLLCSGRDKSTEDCLKSIKKIRDAIGSCEIIVVDTGCDSELQSVIEKYADKVIPFTWCNDFSTARNIGVDAASGEWFMFIDDDEWFEDPTPIIRFFNTGKYKAYTKATYKVRNYANLEGTSWSDSLASRLFKLGDKKITRFHSKIHEVFQEIPGAEYHIECHAEHYGYAFTSKKDRINHSLRNVPLIIDMMKSEPDEIRWPQHLVPEYYVLEEYTKLIDLCHDILAHYKDVSDYKTNIIRPIFYCGLMHGLLSSCNYAQAIIEYNTAISDSRNSLMAKVRLCEFGILAAWNANHNYPKVNEIAAKFYSLLQSCNQPEEINKNPVFSIMDAFNIEIVNQSLILGTVASIYENNINNAHSLFSKIIWEGENITTIPLETIDILEAISNVEYNASLTSFVISLLNCPRTSKMAIDEIQLLIKTNPSVEVKFCRYVSSFESQNFYIKYLQLIDRIHNHDLSTATDLLFKYLNASTSFLMEQQIWIELTNQMVDIPQVLLAVRKHTLNSAVNYLVENSSRDQLIKTREIFQNCFSTNNSHFDYFEIKLNESIICKTNSSSYNSFSTIFDELSIWAKCVKKYYKKYLKKDWQNTSCPIIPLTSSIALELDEFIELYDINHEAALQIIDNTILKSQALTPFINQLSLLYQRDYLNKDL